MSAQARVWRCRWCGCTDEYGCDVGCHWVEADVCSACAGFELAARLEAMARVGEVSVRRQGRRGYVATLSHAGLRLVITEARASLYEALRALAEHPAAVRMMRRRAS